MTDSFSKAPPPISADDPRLAAARPLTLDALALAELELLLRGALRPAHTYRPVSAADATTHVPALHAPFDVALGETLALRNAEGVIFALLEVAEVDPTNRQVSGTLSLVRLPRHHDFPELFAPASEVRPRVSGRVAAYFATGALTPAIAARLRAALDTSYDTLLVFATATDATPGDLCAHLDVLALLGSLRHVDRGSHRAHLVLLPALRPMERDSRLELEATIAKNHGAATLLVADGPPSRSSAEHAGRAQVGIEVRVLPATVAPLEWPDVDALLARANPARAKAGFTVWFTGLSQAGKSTIATLLSRMLLDHGRGSTLLDGDVVRTHLSKGLGFSREDRDTNIRRLGYVASEITRHGGVALVAAISPYRAIRLENRARIGNYVEVFVNAPVATCESRDQKGQYARARRGEIKGFTGVDDPYEPPQAGDGDVLECRTDLESPTQSAARVFQHLVTLGYVDPASRIA